MNNILDIEIILNKQKYHTVYNIGWILLTITLIFIYVSCIYKYKTYYLTTGTLKNNKLEILVRIDDIKYINNNQILEIDNKPYRYNIFKISEELYVDESLNNYKYIYLNVYNLNNIDNYVYEIKLEKENKKIIEHIKDYL